MNLLPAFVGKPEVNRVYHVDLFTLCDALPDKSVDMILCDLPYGTTACAWDTVIPFAPMWERFKRVIKPRGAIVLTASQPFTSALVMSNPEWFRHEWVWDKNSRNNFPRCRQEPIKRHENIVVFADGDGYYNPQMTAGSPYAKYSSNNTHLIKGKTSGAAPHKVYSVNDGERYPTSIQFFASDEKLHPTQKPVALFRYLIRTYTQPGELVLDPCVGSGTSCLAAREEGRNFIAGDTDLGYVEIARKRLAEPFTRSLFLDAPDACDTTDKDQSGSQLSWLPEPTETPETA